jgi:hypothetical protein
MKYLKTNEGFLNPLFISGKDEKAFSKLIQDFENKLTSDGYNFRSEPNRLLAIKRLPIINRPERNILKIESYTITDKNNITYLLKIVLVKETFRKPFIHARIDATKKNDDGTVLKINNSDYKYGHTELDNIDLYKNPLSNIYELLHICKNRIDNQGAVKNITDNFYDNFSIDDIKDNLVDLFDTYGEYKITKSEIKIASYSISFIDKYNFFNNIPAEIYSNKYLKCSTAFVEFINEIDSLTKKFDSMGLELVINLSSIIESGIINLHLYASKVVKNTKNNI